MHLHHRIQYALLLVGVGMLVIVPFVSIQLRLRRNWPIATQLANSLQGRYPKVEFRGAASYKEEVIYVGVFGRLDDAAKQDIEKWLHLQKRELQITPKLLLRYHDESIDQEID